MEVCVWTCISVTLSSCWFDICASFTQQLPLNHVCVIYFARLWTHIEHHFIFFLCRLQTECTSFALLSKMFHFWLFQNFVFHLKPKVRSDCITVCVVCFRGQLVPLVFILTKNGSCILVGSAYLFVWCCSDFNMDDKCTSGRCHIFILSTSVSATELASKSSSIEEKNVAQNMSEHISRLWCSTARSVWRLRLWLPCVVPWRKRSLYCCNIDRRYVVFFVPVCVKYCHRKCAFMLLMCMSSAFRLSATCYVSLTSF